MKRSLLALLAMAMAVSTASAQMDQPAADMPFGGEVRADPVGVPARPAYSPRAVATVYDNLSNVFVNGSGNLSLGANENCIDDCRFAPGPWAAATGRVLTEVSYGVRVHTSATTTEEILVIFWNLNSINFQGQAGNNSSMLAAGSIPLGVLRVDAGGLAPGYIYQLTSPLTGLPGGGIAVPDDVPGVGVQVVWVTHGYTPADYTNLVTNATGSTYSQCSSAPQRAITFGSSSMAPYNGSGASNSPGTANAATVGLTLPDFGRDVLSAAMCPNVGLFVGNGAAAVMAGDPTSATTEHRYLNIFIAGATITAGQHIRLRGVPGPTVACGTADFDGDGDVGTDRDIEAFFRVLAGNPC